MNGESLQYQFPETLNQQKRLGGLPTEEAVLILACAGNVIARAGDRVNPLDRIAFSETLYFVDGDNPQQMAWLKPQLAGQQNFKVILVKGNVHDSSIALDEPVYFDQYGTLTTKIGFEHTPVRISRADRMLRVEEVALK